MIDQKFLESLGVTDESAVQKITETYTVDIKAEQDAAATAKTQLDEANKTIQSYKDMDIDGIQQSAADWQKKYEQAKADRKAKDYSDRLDQFVQQQGMTNAVYADYLKRQLLDKKLQFDDKGELIGGTEAVQELKKTCPDAFLLNPNHPAVAKTSHSTPQAMDGVESAFYAMNPNLKHN